MSVDLEEPTQDMPVDERVRSRKKSFVEWLLLLIAALLVSFGVRTYVFQTFLIPSPSMMPTLYTGNRILVDKLSVEFGSVNIGDMLVFKAPLDVRNLCNDPVTDLVKRVIGLPGDVLSSKGNTIYVNGKALQENWSHY